MKTNETMHENGTSISVLYRGLRPRPLWQGLVAAHIRKLQHLASIASARISLERQHESTPAFRVLATLEVPGPDFHAEASDCTLRAALLKATDNLRRQMQSRKERQLNRQKNKTGPARFGHTQLSRL